MEMNPKVEDPLCAEARLRVDAIDELDAGDEVSVMSGVLSGLDPKPSELPMARLKPR